MILLNPCQSRLISSIYVVFHVEHIKREAQGAKDANVACYYVDDTSLQDEVHDQGYGEFDIKQGMKTL